MLVSTISSLLYLSSMYAALGDRIEFGAGGSALLRGGQIATPDDNTQKEFALQVEPKIGLFRQTRRGTLTLIYNNLVRINFHLKIWTRSRPPIYQQLSFFGERKLSRAWTSIFQLSGGFGELDYVNQGRAFDVEQSQSQRINAALASVATANTSLLLTGKIAPRHSLTVNLDGQYSNLANPEAGCTLKEQFSQGRQQTGGTFILTQQSILSRKNQIGSGASVGTFYFAENAPVPVVATAFLSWRHRWSSESNLSVQSGAAILSTNQAIEKKEALKDQLFTGVAQIDINTLFYSTRDLRLQGQWSAGIAPFVDPISAQASPRLLTSSNVSFSVQPKWNGTLAVSFAAPIDVEQTEGPPSDRSPTPPSNTVVPVHRIEDQFGIPSPVMPDPEDPNNPDPPNPDPEQDPEQDPNQVSFGQQQSIISVGLNFSYAQSEWLSFTWGATFNARGSSLNNLNFSSRQFDIFAFAGIQFAINQRGRGANWLR